MEQGEISDWSETDKTDNVSYNLVANGKKGKKNSYSYQKTTKSMSCVYFNDGSCSYTKHHETKGVYCRHICIVCFDQDGKISTHTAGECKQNTRKRVGLDMATGYHTGPVQSVLLDHKPLANPRTRIYYHSKADSSSWGGSLSLEEVVCCQKLVKLIQTCGPKSYSGYKVR